MPGVYRITVVIGTDQDGLDFERALQKAATKEGVTVSAFSKEAIKKAMEKVLKSPSE